MGKLKKLYSTVSQLRVIQVLYRIKYIFKRKFIEKYGNSVFKSLEKKYSSEKINIKTSSKFLINDRKHYLSDINEVLENRITFLNRSIEFGEKIDWHRDELNKGTRLWKLNLNYHEFLIDIAYAYKETGKIEYLDYLKDTIYEWLNQNPLGTKGYGKDNWNSYAISLRLISWIKIYEAIGEKFDNKFCQFFIKLLWIQSEFLRKNLEYDILGNHLIKNWKALHWCKHFFDTYHYDKSIQTLNKYVEEQFTENGMHEELSPMYAAIVLEDLLEVFILDPKSLKEPLLHKLFSNIKYLSFENDYSFFNDSVTKNGVQPDDLSNFYYKAFPKKQDISIEGNFNIDGYIGKKSENLHLIVDMAKVIEGNQPGHLQCDALSFELALKGKKILTNSGTYEYNAGKRRYYSRSTQSHNTLKYGDFDQSQIWGSFRVAKKAKTSYEIHELTNDKVKVVGQVSGFDFNKNITHRRELNYRKSYLKVVDELISEDGKESSQIFYHLTPEFKFVDDQIVCKKTNTFVAKIKSSESWEVKTTEFYEQFGYSQEKETLVIKNIPPNKEVTLEIHFNE